jgi:hypothetical protein
VIKIVAAGTPFGNLKTTLVPGTLSLVAEVSTWAMDKLPAGVDVVDDCNRECSDVTTLEMPTSVEVAKAECVLDAGVAD